MSNKHLNLGGGPLWKREGWTNLDQEFGYRLENNLLKEFEDNSILKIFFSHTLEHLQPNIAREIMFQCYRILEKNGIIRIVVPDCELFTKAYLEGNDDFFLKNDKLTPHFPNLTETTIEMGGNRNDFNKESNIGHYFFWDKYSVTWLLLCSGFRKIKLQEFSKSLDSEMCEVATMEEKIGMPLNGFDNPMTMVISAYIEAIK